MGRLARVVATDVPHHLTQRGNGRRFVLDCDADRSVYLNLLRENAALYKVSVIGYCLMSNHIHLIAVPGTADGLAQALKHAHGRYASYWNAAHQSSGHVWQGRYYSCPLDEAHLWEALRYTESIHQEPGWFPTRRRGRGQAQPATAGRGKPMRLWLWRYGAVTGPLQHGGSTSRLGNQSPGLLSFDNAPTRAGRWEISNSSIAWRK
jgi:REP element-mobilizing transposase RayT